MRQRRRHAKLLFFRVSSAQRETLWGGRKAEASLARSLLGSGVRRKDAAERVGGEGEGDRSHAG